MEILFRFSIIKERDMGKYSFHLIIEILESGSEVILFSETLVKSICIPKLSVQDSL
jgi:hypothetical protein